MEVIWVPLGSTGLLLMNTLINQISGVGVFSYKSFISLVHTHLNPVDFGDFDCRSNDLRR